MHYLLAYTAAKDSLDRLTRNREAVEIQTMFETERKDAEILALSQANRLKELKLLQFTWFISGLVGLAILIVLVAGILHSQSRLKNSRKTLLLQQQLLRSQMNPHFLFSSLASIQNFIIHKRPSEAGDYLSRFAKLVRQILKSSSEESRKSQRTPPKIRQRPQVTRHLHLTGAHQSPQPQATPQNHHGDH
jgi:hypothetical protein